MQWGIHEKYHWRPRCALYDKDWNIKPNGQAYLDLVKGKWWLNVRGETDAKGLFNVRGHEGDYRITVKKGEKKIKKDIFLAADGKSVEIIID